jgi:hypothetical protein
MADPAQATTAMLIHNLKTRTLNPLVKLFEVLFLGT